MPRTNNAILIDTPIAKPIAPQQVSKRGKAPASATTSAASTGGTTATAFARLSRLIHAVEASLDRSSHLSPCTVMTSHQTPNMTTITRAGALGEFLLDLSRVPHLESSMAHLIAALREQPMAVVNGITGLSFSHNALGDDGVLRLLEQCLLCPAASIQPATMAATHSLTRASFLSEVTCLDLFEVGLTDDGLMKLISLIGLGGDSSRLNCALPERSKGGMCLIEKLKIGDNKITDHGLSAIATALAGPLKHLTQLHVGGNPVHSFGLHALADAWRNTPHCIEQLGLRSLAPRSLHEAAAFHDGMTDLLTALGGRSRVVSGSKNTCNGLVELQLRGTVLTIDAVRGLAIGFVVPPVIDQAATTPTTIVGAKQDSVHHPPSAPLSYLESLDVSSCGLTDDMGAILLTHIHQASSCVIPQLFQCKEAYSHNGTDAAMQLPPTLALRELQLQNNHIGRTSCYLLGCILGGGGDATYPDDEKASRMASRSMPYMHQSSGTSHRSHLLNVTCPLATLDVSCNRLESSSIAVLFQQWAQGRSSSCLNSFVASGNQVGSDAAKAMVNVLRLQHQCGTTAIGPTGHNAVESNNCWMKRRILLSSLSLSSCGIDGAAATILFDGLALYPGRFRVLDMSNNSCGATSIPSLCRLLQYNRTLSKLHLQDNHVSLQNDVAAVVAALEHNPTVREFSFGGQSKAANALSTMLREQISKRCTCNKSTWIAVRAQRSDAVNVHPNCNVLSIHSVWDMPCVL